MFCPFGDWPCISIPVLVLMLIAVTILLWLGIRALRHSLGEQPDASSHLSGKPDDEAEDEEEDLKVGQKILYDKSSNNQAELNLVITETDEENNRITGFFEVTIPAGAEVVGKPKYDHEFDRFDLSYRLGNGVTTVWFDNKDPDELDGWETLWNSITVKPSELDVVAPK